MSENWKVVKVGDVCVTNKRTYSLSENWDFVNYLDCRASNYCFNKLHY